MLKERRKGYFSKFGISFLLTSWTWTRINLRPVTALDLGVENEVGWSTRFYVLDSMSTVYELMAVARMRKQSMFCRTRNGCKKEKEVELN